MTRPKIKIEKTTIDKSIEVFTFLLKIGSAILIGYFYNQLPEKIPIHFNWPSKDENGFGTKNLLWTSPIICGIITIAVFKLNQYPWIFNYPTEINDKNARYNYKQATLMLRIVGLLIALLCFTVTVLSLLDGLEVENNLNNYLTPLFPILLIATPIFFAIRILILNKK